MHKVHWAQISDLLAHAFHDNQASACLFEHSAMHGTGGYASRKSQNRPAAGGRPAGSCGRSCRHESHHCQAFGARSSPWSHHDNAAAHPCLQIDANGLRESGEGSSASLSWPTAWYTRRFGSTAIVLAKCMLKYYRISECGMGCRCLL